MLPSRFTALNAVDASVNNTSVIFPTDHVLNMSLVSTVTGTSTGTLTINVSNAIAGAAGLPPSSSFVSSGVTASIAGAGLVLTAKFDYCYEWMQLVYTKTNGAAGTLTVDVKTNGL